MAYQCGPGYGAPADPDPDDSGWAYEDIGDGMPTPVEVDADGES